MSASLIAPQDVVLEPGKLPDPVTSLFKSQAGGSSSQLQRG